jgi:Tol biopolymer transport system component
MNNRHAFWSPDGLSLMTTFQGRGIATFDLVSTSVATGDVAVVGQFTNMVKMVGWMKDGRIAWIASDPSGTGTRIVTSRPGGEIATVLGDLTRTEEARVSPDGGWIAYATTRSGRHEVEVSSFPTAGPRYPVSSEGGGYPRWRSDGRELFFLSANNRLMAASFTAGPRPTIGKPAPLFEVTLIAHPDRGNFAEYEYDVNADGTRFLINRMVTPAQSSLAIVVDWNPPR